MNLATAFAESAQKNAAKTAIFWGDVEFSYGALLDQSRLLAGHLQQSL